MRGKTKKVCRDERQILMQEDPPTVKPNLLELFKVARSETEYMEEVQRGVVIGKRINKGIADALPKKK